MNFNKGEFFKCCGDSKSFPKESMPEVVFVGRSNVGKSSIINRLLNRKKIAKISSTPGKTVTINFYKLVDGFLVDLPGYGYAKVSMAEREKWHSLTDSYFFGKRNIVLVVVVIDCRRGLLDFDLQMIDFLVQNKFKFVVVLNKIDKISKLALEDVVKNTHDELDNFENIDFPEIISISCKNSKDIEKLKEYILTFDDKLKLLS